jgi:hypothetical protein
LLFNLNRDSPVSVFLTWLSLLKMGWLDEKIYFNFIIFIDSAIFI